MNIALGGIIILMLLMPGIIFRKGYLSGEFSREYTVQDFFELLINTLLPSLFFYLLGLLIASLLGYYCNIKILLGLLSSDNELLKSSLRNIENHKIEILIFHLFTYIIAFIAGLCLKNLTIKRRWDSKSSFLKFDNIWHYLLTAKFIEFPRSQIKLTDNIDIIDFTYVYAVEEIGGKAYIYNGILVDYELSKDGGLNLIYLKGAERTDFQDDANSLKIDGNILILKYENIININLSFITTYKEIQEDGSELQKFRIIE